jgi:ABC-type dipeptide/oligopeptide/nickel transport system permease component
MNVWVFCARRLVFVIFMLWSITILIFFLSHVVPGDPARLIAGPKATREQVQSIRVRLGLDRPLSEQYLRYMGDLLKGDLGESVLNGRPVADNLRRFFPATIELTIVAFFIAALAGVPLGVISAIHRDSVIDHLSRLAALVGIAFPMFWVGIILILVFFFRLGWLPGGGQVDTRLIIEDPVPAVTNALVIDAALAGKWTVLSDALRHLVLPSFTLAMGPLARFTRFTRAVMLEVMGEDYLRVARAKGLAERAVVWRHALRNALIPTVTMMGLAIGYMLGGSVLVETVFNWPGIGQYAYESILTLDYPSILGTTLLATTVFLFSNLIVDILYVMLDPRIEYS